MWSRPESDEALLKRMLPETNPNRVDRVQAWVEWQSGSGERAVLKFIRTYNDSRETDEDLLQEALLTAYIEVERGHYQPQAGIPFTAYVKGIARNKIREARRRARGWVSLDEIHEAPSFGILRQLEVSVDVHLQREILRSGMKRLPEARRQVLERYFTGESTEEIAAALQISPELVRQHKCRGLRSLRQMDAVRLAAF